MLIQKSLFPRSDYQPSSLDGETIRPWRCNTCFSGMSIVQQLQMFPELPGSLVFEDRQIGRPSRYLTRMERLVVVIPGQQAVCVCMRMLVSLGPGKRRFSSTVPNGTMEFPKEKMVTAMMLVLVVMILRRILKTTGRR